MEMSTMNGGAHANGDASTVVDKQGAPGLELALGKEMKANGINGDHVEGVESQKPQAVAT